MPASYKGRTYSEVWLTPWDDVHGDLEARLHWCFQQNKGPVRQTWYGITSDTVLQDNLALLARGIDVRGVFDHMQYMSPVEHRKVLPFLEQCKSFAHLEPPFLVGTSPVASAFIHEKAVVFNAPINGYDVEDNEFESLEDAFAAGYPVTMFGSWNPTLAGSQQENVCCFMPGKNLALAFVAGIEKVRLHIITHQGRYQP